MIRSEEQKQKRAKKNDAGRPWDVIKHMDMSGVRVPEGDAWEKGQKKHLRK